MALRFASKTCVSIPNRDFKEFKLLALEPLYYLVFKVQLRQPGVSIAF